jgi:hypothetical protein
MSWVTGIVFSGTPDALKHDTEVQRHWLEASDAGSDCQRANFAAR